MTGRPQRPTLVKEQFVDILDIPVEIKFVSRVKPVWPTVQSPAGCHFAAAFRISAKACSAFFSTFRPRESFLFGEEDGYQAGIAAPSAARVALARP